MIDSGLDPLKVFFAIISGMLIPLLLWVVIPISCTTQSGANSINPIYFTDQVEIDGCEYVIINGANGRDIEHKFNCKNEEHNPYK